MYSITMPRRIATVLMLSTVFWASGLPIWLNSARAAALTNISDTISDSDLSQVANHAFAFTTATGLDASDTIVFTLDPTTSLFAIGTLGVSDVTTESGLDVVSSCTAGASELTMATTSTTITLTVCTGDTISAGAKTLTFGGTKITNPGVANSYIMRVRTTNDGSTTRDTADTRVAIIDDVTVTASVDTRFTFTIIGVANGATVNGDATATATTTTATSVPFETLSPGTAKVLAQDLTVDTNARNGFTVTVFQDQNLTSATGADIDQFIDGAGTATPAAWQAPANTLGSEATYGHFGITSEDSSLTAGDEFGSALYAGNISTARQVFYHNGPADGSTAHQGRTRIGYKVQIGSLQEAGTDYSNTLTFVATPTF